MRLQSFLQILNNQHRLLGLMLISLIAAILSGPETAISKSLMLVHFGLFLIWQPIYKGEYSLSVVSMIVFFALISVFITKMNLWTTTFWLLLLLSLLNGRMFSRGINRASYGLGVIILFLELILVLTPSLFDLYGIHTSAQKNINILLIVLCLPLLFVPVVDKSDEHVDFIRGFMFVLLTLFLCMGSVIISITLNKSYLEALATTIFLSALFLFTASFLWAPRAGFSGIARLWEQYLLNIGGPFEQWITRLSILEINTKIEPETFLQLNIENLLQREWIAGAHWITDFSELQLGRKTDHMIEYHDPKLKITIFTTTNIGSALALHTRLLLSVLTFYYRSKMQERQLINQAHMKAVYETGSKLTHDVKNILQSMQNLTQVVTDENNEHHESYSFMRRQMPLLTQRLKSTLDRLQSPQNSQHEMSPISVWLENIRLRMQDRSIQFSNNLTEDLPVHEEALDAAVENLIDNARQKRMIEQSILINIHVETSEDRFKVTVCDNGSRIPDGIASRLLKSVVESESGFGIGLYQTHKQLSHLGYSISLRDNKDGEVCFEING